MRGIKRKGYCLSHGADASPENSWNSYAYFPLGSTLTRPGVKLDKMRKEVWKWGLSQPVNECPSW